MRSGFVMLDNDTLDRLIAKDPDAFRAWAWLARHANWGDGERWFAGHRVALSRGQVVTSTRGLATALGLTHKVARRCLEQLERRGLVRLAAVDGQHTLVTVGHTEGHAERPAEGHADEAGKAAQGAPEPASCGQNGHTEGHAERPAEGHESVDQSKTDEVPIDEAHTNARAREGDAEVILSSLMGDCRAATHWLRRGVEGASGCPLLEGRDFDEAAWAAELAALRDERRLSPMQLLETVGWAYGNPFWRSRIKGAAWLREHWPMISRQARQRRRA